MCGFPLESHRSEGRLMPPTLANGKICYIEIPAADIARSSDFYKQVFGWNIRKRGDASISFDDTAGEVSGTDRKSTRLNSSHANISYAVFCLKKKKKITS